MDVELNVRRVLCAIIVIMSIICTVICFSDWFICIKQNVLYLVLNNDFETFHVTSVSGLKAFKLFDIIKLKYTLLITVGLNVVITVVKHFKYKLLAAIATAITMLATLVKCIQAIAIAIDAKRGTGLNLQYYYGEKVEQSADGSVLVGIDLFHVWMIWLFIVFALLVILQTVLEEIKCRKRL